MQARRAARESALTVLSQFNENSKRDKNAHFDELILKSVRILTNAAYEDLKPVTAAILDMKDYLEDYEMGHPDNAERPMNSEYKPVPMPLTKDMKERLTVLEDVCEKAFAALDIAEMATLTSCEETGIYAKKILEAYFKNSDEIDGMIAELAKGWDFSRLVKTDKDIMRIAVAELLYVKETPVKVVIDEAVEIAKRYSTQDSSSFINGILAKVVAENVDI